MKTTLIPQIEFLLANIQSEVAPSIKTSRDRINFERAISPWRYTGSKLLLIKLIFKVVVMNSTIHLNRHFPRESH